MSEPEPPPPEAGRQSSSGVGGGCGGMILGFFIYLVLNITVALGWLSVGNGNRGNAVAWGIGGAVLLALVALGGGLALCLLTREFIVKGLGAGLILGWALLSIVSAGTCTGLNPTLYH
jgi:hypothetical protein